LGQKSSALRFKLSEITDTIEKSAADSSKQTLIEDAARLRFLQRAFGISDGGIYYDLNRRLNILERFGIPAPSTPAEQKWLKSVTPQDFLSRALGLGNKLWQGEEEIGKVDFTFFMSDAAKNKVGSARNVQGQWYPVVKNADGSSTFTETTMEGKRLLRGPSSVDILVTRLENGNDRILNLKVGQGEALLLDQILSTFKFTQ